MDIFNAARAMLGPIGFLDWDHGYSNVVNIALRVMCIISTFFIMIPALLHTIFVADTFVLRIATAIPLIIGVTNTLLYVSMLIQRPKMASMLTKLKRIIQERMKQTKKLSTQQSTDEMKKKNVFSGEFHR